VENRESFFAGWNPAAREPPKRRHFAAIIFGRWNTSIPTLRSLDLSAAKKRRIPKGFV
jgi:hypothetical protein